MPRRKTILSFGGKIGGGPQTVTGTLTVGGQILAADGTAGAPGYAWASDPDTGLYRASGEINFSVDAQLKALFSGGAGIAALRLRQNTASIIFGSGDDLRLERDAANVLALRNGTNAQAYRIYGTTDAGITNYERLSISAAVGGPFAITSEQGGSGVIRNLKLDPGAADLQWGKALVALGGGAPATLGTIGGTGPATLTQNTWMRVLDSTGAAFWVPAWK